MFRPNFGWAFRRITISNLPVIVAKLKYSGAFIRLSNVGIAILAHASESFYSCKASEVSNASVGVPFNNFRHLLRKK